jgi:hypothetical protein
MVFRDCNRLVTAAVFFAVEALELIFPPTQPSNQDIAMGTIYHPSPEELRCSFCPAHVRIHTDLGS